MCPLLGVARAGYYAWLDHPISDRGQEDARLLQLIRTSFIASHGIYGAPRVLQDLRDRGETCSKHRVARLMQENGLRALHGYPSTLRAFTIRYADIAYMVASHVQGDIVFGEEGGCGLMSGLDRRTCLPAPIDFAAKVLI